MPRANSWPDACRDLDLGQPICLAVLCIQATPLTDAGTMNRHYRINRQFVLKVAAPTVAISLLLFALGILAARNVHAVYLNSSELIVTEVHGMIAAQDLYTDMREIRYQLLLFEQNRREQHVQAIPEVILSATKLMESADRLAHSPQELGVMQVIRKTWAQFNRNFENFQKTFADHSAKVSVSVQDLIEDIDEVIAPAAEFLELNRDVVDKTNEANRHTADQTQQGFLLLGISGGSGGLIAGLVIARSISESIVQLDVSVRGAVGKLSDVVGPITITRSGDFRELEAGLLQMENHITTVVARLQQHEMESLHREQLAALGQLAAGLAHELRNPLTPIKILVQGALERNNGSSLSREHLQLIESEVIRLERLLQDFLDFARPPTPIVKRTDLRQLADGAVELVLARAQSQGVELRRNDPQHPVMADIDLAQMNQVILNLLLNSLDMLASGGWIEITIRSHDSLVAAPRRSDSLAGPTITIRDSGPGFAPEILSRLFQPFVSTKETGTGLGLSICQRIVETHQGIITATNCVDGGAMITITLPPQSRDLISA